MPKKYWKKKLTLISSIMIRTQKEIIRPNAKYYNILLFYEIFFSKFLIILQLYIFHFFQLFLDVRIPFFPVFSSFSFFSYFFMKKKNLQFVWNRTIRTAVAHSYRLQTQSPLRHLDVGIQNPPRPEQPILHSSFPFFFFFLFWFDWEIMMIRNDKWLDMLSPRVVIRVTWKIGNKNGFWNSWEWKASSSMTSLWNWTGSKTPKIYSHWNMFFIDFSPDSFFKAETKLLISWINQSSQAHVF